MYPSPELRLALMWIRSPGPTTSKVVQPESSEGPVGSSPPLQETTRNSPRTAGRDRSVRARLTAGQIVLTLM